MVDLVPSDVLASFLLAAAMQRADRSAALKTVLTGDDSAEKAREAERETADITASLFLLLHFPVAMACLPFQLQSMECIGNTEAVCISSNLLSVVLQKSMRPYFLSQAFCFPWTMLICFDRYQACITFLKPFVDKHISLNYLFLPEWCITNCLKRCTFCRGVCQQRDSDLRG